MKSTRISMPVQKGRMLISNTLMHRRVHFSDGEYIIPVEMHIKEFSNRNRNKLYVSVTLRKIKEDRIMAYPSKQKTSANIANPSSEINVAQLISKVNPDFLNFCKYAPSELLNNAQCSLKPSA